jgi:hypothetical protein
MPFRRLQGDLRGAIFDVLVIFDGFPLDRVFAPKHADHFLICLLLLLSLGCGLLHPLSLLNYLDMEQGIANVVVQHS